MKKNLSSQWIIKHYDWGRKGKNAIIPKLLGIVPEPGKPYAELWFGNGLPCLIKVLDISKPLSLQCHPDRIQALKGFKREERQRISLHGKERIYKDPNPKPEMVIALSDFYALCGFKKNSWIQLKDLFSQTMNLDQRTVNIILYGLARRIIRENRSNPYSKDQSGYWFIKAHNAFKRNKDYDRGLFSFYFCNLVHLRPGEALYLPPGEVHSYLEGVALEVSGNSDNTLRGGLTSKKVNITEFLKALTFSMGIPEKLTEARYSKVISTF